MGRRFFTDDTPMDDIDFTLDDEIQSIMAPPTQEERDTMERNILDGLHVDHLVIAIVDGQRILADGYTRLSICRANGIPFKTRERKFASRESLIAWVIDNQMGRRNLTEERKAYFRGKQYLNLRKNTGNPMFSQLSQNETIGGDTAGEVAKKHKVSRATVNRDAKFAEAADTLPPAEKEAVLDGKSEVPKSSIADGAKPFCPACARKLRVGQELPNACPDCKALRSPKEEPKNEHKKKTGRQLFDDKTITDMIGKLVRSLDDRSKVYGKGPKHTACRDALDKLLSAFTQWQIENR